MLKDYGYYRAVFGLLPVAACIADSDVRIVCVNRALMRSFGLKEMKAPLLGGLALNCFRRTDDSRGCGYGRHCSHCIIRNSVKSAIDGRCEIRAEGKFTTCRGGAAKELTLRISASHIPYGTENTAVVTIEDVSILQEDAANLPE